MDAPTTVARLACDEPTARRLAGYFSECLDPEATACAAFEGDNGRWHLAIHFREPPDEPALRATMQIAAGSTAAAALTIEPVAPADWVAESLRGLQPVRAGRFIVHGAHDRARVRHNDIGIEIEAALAFGTGHHGTTRGCLLALDDLAKRGMKRLKVSHRHPEVPAEGRPRRMIGRRPSRLATLAPQGDGERLSRKRSVLDLGTGSGVLAIAAAKIFRQHVVASDIDPVAVNSAKANARLNRAAAIGFVRAAGVKSRAIAKGAPYDLIFANILLGPLMRLAVPLSRLAGRRARVVLSGLLPGHANAVLAIYRAQGLTLERRIPLDGWVTLVLKHNRPGRG